LKPKGCLIKKTEIFSLLVLLTFSNSVFCAKKTKNTKANSEGQVKATYTATPKKNKETPAEVLEITEETPVTSGESITLPTQKRTFFSKIEPEIVSGVENGSPESLRLAMSKLRKNESEYEENEKVLIAVASEIMKTVWASEKITWEVFAATTENSYIGAIDSANKGVFDSSTGNTDFLLTILPALVLLKPAATAEVYEPCEQAVKQALERNPTSVLANYLMGEVLSLKKDYPSALNYFQKAYESSKATREIILAYSTCLRQTGNLELSAQVLGSLDIGTDVPVLKQNAYLAFAKKDYEAAAEYVARVLQQNPNDLEFLLFRAKILIEEKDYIHAVSLLDMYARQESSSLDYLLLRAKVQLDWSKNTTAAAETIEKALSLYPDSDEVLKVAAKIASVTDSKVCGLYADEFAGKILEKDPDNPEALNYALDGLIQRKNWNESYVICKKIIDKGNVSPELIQKYVIICLNSSKEQEAYDYVKKMKDAYPGEDLILQSYILAYSKVGSRDEVIKYIDSLMNTSSSKLKSNLYYRRSFLQQTEENQLADLRSSLISNPRNGDALFRLYEIYFGKKDYRKAQYYLRQVVAINPNDSSVKQLNEALTQLMQ